jgi:transposase
MAQAQQPEGLKARPHPGPRARLTAEQESQLEMLLMAGATSHGWDDELWTAPRVAQLIRRYFAIDYHPDHVRRLLKKRLGWTSQRPQYRARERTTSRINRWRRQEMQRIKKIG